MRLIQFFVLLLLLWISPVVRAMAQEAPSQALAHAGTIPALFVSDIHFDPFHDPGKAQKLAMLPMEQWPGVLEAPPSPDAEIAYSRLQAKCDARGTDTPYGLLQSSLAAMQTNARDAKFIVVSGDLLAHQFDCRFRNLIPGGTPASYMAFVDKTLRYLSQRLRETFPGIPIYLALGNNDSACGDYRFDAESPFLSHASSIFAETLPAPERRKAEEQFRAGGYYSIPMAAPMEKTQLIVLNDVLLSTGYFTCSGKRDTSEGEAEMEWLAGELAAARKSKRRVWVVAHIPPGIDVYSTLKRAKVCGDSPAQFLNSDKLRDLLGQYADVVKLAVFAHTHMDELRLIEPAEGGAESSGGGEAGVPVKIVPSISPVDGNRPAFLVAEVEPSSATLRDYSVYVNTDSRGADAPWPKEYTYSQVYGQPSFSPAALKELIAHFQASSFEDPKAKAYIKYFYPGFVPLGVALPLVWPEYKCAFSNLTGNSYLDCACAAKK